MATDANDNEEEEVAPKKNKIKRIVLILLFLIIFLGVGGAGVYFLLGDDDDEDYEDEEDEIPSLVAPMNKAPGAVDAQKISESEPKPKPKPKPKKKVKHEEEPEPEMTAEERLAKEGAPPVYLPMDMMVANLADSGGDRVAQVGVTLELDDEATSDRIKARLPAVRSAILLMLSQRTSEELLVLKGKELLAGDIYREISESLGYAITRAEDIRLGKRLRYNPIRRVLFTHFIIQ